MSQENRDGQVETHRDASAGSAQGGGFYEVKYRDPNGVVVDITENGWGGAAKDVVGAGGK